MPGFYYLITNLSQQILSLHIFTVYHRTRTWKYLSLYFKALLLQIGYHWLLKLGMFLILVKFVMQTESVRFKSGYTKSKCI